MPDTALVFVHGRSQGGKDPAILKATWLDSLRQGLGSSRASILDGVEVRFPFYGDELDAQTAKLDATAPAHLLTRGDASNADQDFIVYQQLILEHVAQEYGVTDDDIRAELRPGPQERGPGSWPWVQAILRALDKVPGLSADALAVIMRDVYAYITRRTARRAIDAIVAPAIKGRCVVVAHSLGTVVAYNIMKNAGESADVPLYCTVGSPLGVAPIRSAMMPLVLPKGTKAWFNAFDKGDVVALYSLSSDLYPFKPPIENDDTLKNKTENHHGIVEYLNKGPVADHIFAALTR